MSETTNSQAGVKIELHLIQNFAPSNLNRDDTGQPKSATFGGFRRARVSSQCTKRSAREWWKEANTISVGDRTKKLQALIAQALADDAEFTTKVADQALRAEGIRVFTDAFYAAADKKKPENTSVLLFVSPGEVEVCVKAVKDLWDDRAGDPQTDGEEGELSGKKKGKEASVEGIASVANKRLKAAEKASKSKKDDSASDEAGGDESANKDDSTTDEAVTDSKDKKKDVAKLKTVKMVEDKIKAAQISADIALFGRMLAEQPGRNTDGACQVAHPISTHKVDMEMDFYTAVDDLNPREETGAGMMGVVGFNSACYYRYALVDRDQLARNLARKTERDKGSWKEELTADDYAEADKVIEAFLEAMVYAIPTGKQNSFAAQNLPAFGLFVRRQGGVPVSLANAFAKPVRTTKADDDLVGLSVEALTKHWESLTKVYGDQGVKAKSLFHVEQEGRLNGLAQADKVSVSQAVKAVVSPSE